MIWCLGMYSSGSTWLYNAARAVAGELGLRRGCGFAANFRELNPLLAADQSAIVKTHELDAKAAQLAARRATAILISVRDPRDAVASMMTSMQLTAAASFSLVERAAWQIQRCQDDPRGLVFRYENGYIDDPATFDQLATVFGGRLAPAARDRLFAESRRAAIDAQIARMVAAADPHEADVVDTASQWHGHHAQRTGEIGRWARVLAPDTVAMVESRLAVWMRDHGYAVTATMR